MELKEAQLEYKRKRVTVRIFYIAAAACFLAMLCDVIGMAIMWGKAEWTNFYSYMLLGEGLWMLILAYFTSQAKAGYDNAKEQLSACRAHDIWKRDFEDQKDKVHEKAELS